MLRNLLFMAALWAVGEGALAASAGFYGGASFTNVNADVRGPSSIGRKDQDDGFKIVAGARPLQWLAIEANYVDAGRTSAPLQVFCIALVGVNCPFEHSVDIKALSLAALGMVRFKRVEFFARAGASRWETDQTTLSTGGAGGPLRMSVEDDGIEPIYGAGVQLVLSKVAVRAEYERLELSSDSADMVSIGITYRFF